MYDILIAGAGPAGMTAAIYGARGGKSVLMADKMSYGGQIINTPEVENYPGTGKVSGFQLAQDMYDQAVGLGAEMTFGEVTGIEKTEEGFLVRMGDGSTYEAKSVILATGVKNRPAGLEREEQMTGAGISYCATCDGAFFRKKDVIVLGGGNTALEDAEYLTALCNKVYLVHRRDKFRGEEITVKRLAAKENVEFILDSVPVEILGDTKVTGLKVKNVKTEETREIPASAVFVAYGRVPENGAFAEFAALDGAGFFASQEDCLTETKGLFVAGDARAKVRRQLVTATADGATAAMAAIDYLNSLEG